MDRATMAVAAPDVAPRKPSADFPSESVAKLGASCRRPLGDLFGLENFGVNLILVRAGAKSAFLHSHSRLDEFVYIRQGMPTLRLETSEARLEPGMCVGFSAGEQAHQLINEPVEDVLLLEIGDRGRTDEVRYPEDDLLSLMNCVWERRFLQRDGLPFSSQGFQQ